MIRPKNSQIPSLVWNSEFWARHVDFEENLILVKTTQKCCYHGIQNSTLEMLPLVKKLLWDWLKKSLVSLLVMNSDFYTKDVAFPNETSLFGWQTHVSSLGQISAICTYDVVSKKIWLLVMIDNLRNCYRVPNFTLGLLPSNETWLLWTDSRRRC